MRFRFVEKDKVNFSIFRMCKIPKVSKSGYYAWVSRPSSRRQRDDMMYLAHIRAKHKRNYCAYARKRMTDELRDQGVAIGGRRVGRYRVCTERCITFYNSNRPHFSLDRKTPDQFYFNLQKPISVATLQRLELTDKTATNCSTKPIQLKQRAAHA